MKKDKKPARILTAKEAEAWARTMEPFKIPTFRQRKQGECDNCAEYIVCWEMDEPREEDIPKICKYRNNK